jgi:hypothetical protein
LYAAPANSASISSASSANSCCWSFGQVGIRSNTALTGSLVITRSLSDPGRPVSHDALPVDAAHAEVFDFEEFLDAVF